MRFTECNEPTTLDAIRGFETQLGKSLPQSYVDFLLTYNGGVPGPDNDYVDVPGWNELIVNVFLGITKVAETSLLEDHFTNFSDPIDEQFLYIAYDPFSQRVMMDLRPKTYGRIYIRSHVYPPDEMLQIDDTGFTPNDYEEARLYVPVAESFEAFLAMLGPEPEDE
jgi:SMI1-KNR4 cell-wall